ncbi:hypothetical protein JL722_8918 [Aureococcus anophagefferens]|nr:hypothetical protein JL722_8918 [Aureococcus anophagefferens]
MSHPFAAQATAMGNVCFALMALAVGPNATAQPQGVSAVLLAVILSQVVAPERASRGDAVSSYEAALFVASLVGFLELLMAPFVAQLKASVPSAALHASVAGQALVGLTMGFAGDVFAAPADALGPLVVCFCCYGAQVRLPYNAPGGAGALALGALLAAPLRAVFGGDAGGGRAAGPVPWATLAVVSPPSLGGLPHLARAYASRESLKSWWASPRSMGARHGYMLGSGFVALVVGCSPRLMVWVTAAFPLAAGAGFLFWIGLAVTASAFSPASSGLHSSHFASAAATAMGLVPVIAAWGTQLVSSTTAAAGADARRVFGDLQRAGVDASGLAALAQGSLLSSVSLAATLASVLDRHFGAAALWSLLNAALAGLGFIHAYRIDHAAVVADVGGLVFLRNSKALQAAVGYLLAAAILLWFSVREDIELRPDALRRRLLRVRDFCLPRRRRHRGAGDERSPLVAQLPKPSAQFLPIHAAPEPARAQSRDAAASF